MTHQDQGPIDAGKLHIGPLTVVHQQVPFHVYAFELDNRVGIYIDVRWRFEPNGRVLKLLVDAGTP